MDKNSSLSLLAVLGCAGGGVGPIRPDVLVHIAVTVHRSR